MTPKSYRDSLAGVCPLDHLQRGGLDNAAAPRADAQVRARTTRNSAPGSVPVTRQPAATRRYRIRSRPWSSPSGSSRSGRSWRRATGVHAAARRVPRAVGSDLGDAFALAVPVGTFARTIAYMRQRAALPGRNGFSSTPTSRSSCGAHSSARSATPAPDEEALPGLHQAAHRLPLAG
jgi:hypothetical protein